MKKVGILFSGLLVAAGLMVLSPVSAKAYEENGFYYEVDDDKEATITGSFYDWEKGEQQELVIPSRIGGFPVTKVGSYAFSGRQYEVVTIPNSVNEIGNGAFSSNSTLKSITLPAGLTSIASSMFSNCSKLTNVKVGEQVTSIQEDAFYNCISLKEIRLPNKVRIIHDGAFSRCYKLKEVTMGSKLTRIGQRAFNMNYDLKKVSFPKSLKKIDDSAFESCTDLASISFKNPETKLGKRVFQGCKSLATATLPSKIKNVPENTFYNCQKLTKVKFPKTVSIIKKKAFKKCYALKSVELTEKTYAIGDQVFADSGLRKIMLNDNLQFIGNGAFQNTDLKKLTLHNKVTYIGNRVVADCRKLKKISVPASVKGINPGAFNNCISLRAINVAAGNKKYSSQAGVLFNKDKTKLIQYPLHKTSVSFVTPSTLRNIRSNAFAENAYLKSVTITARTIGDHAFASMNKLESVTIQNGAVKIGDSAFKDNIKMKKLVLPDSIQKIGAEAFVNSSVRIIHIPSSLKSLGYDAFMDCHKIASFEGGQGYYYKVKDGVLYNKNMTKLIKYPSRKKEKSFSVPNSIKSVSSYAFDRTSNLVKLEFGSRLTNIGYHAVYKAKRLKSVTFKTKKLGYSSAPISDCNRLAVIVGPSDSVMQGIAGDANATLITL